MMHRDDVVILDVRNNYEYDLGHFKNAIKIDVEASRYSRHSFARGSLSKFDWTDDDWDEQKRHETLFRVKLKCVTTY